MVAAPSIAPSDAPRRGRGGRRRLTPQRALFFALFLGAPLLLYILFVVWPVLQAIFYSLTNWRGLAATPDIGRASCRERVSVCAGVVLVDTPRLEYVSRCAGLTI